jgi:mannose-binding lectin
MQPYVDIMVTINLELRGKVMAILYAQTTGSQQTNSGNFTPIPGLNLTLPEGVNVLAIVTLNLPNPYAEGNDFPGATLGISVNGTVLPVMASFTYGVQAPVSFNRMPTTLVVGVPLTSKAQPIQAMWSGVRGSTVIIDSPATLSAVI